ncbi:Uncharacterized protein dnm_018600 [Desulfonema magnum]|uniref:Transposase n=1 Tax=Desulfonema magnum TaxID=45655 RepID=A0A975GLQ5_9BACT|nr:Uncharacterized protein dnm_018600 [Desulfonema magnum]
MQFGKDIGNVAKLQVWHSGIYVRAVRNRLFSRHRKYCQTVSLALRNLCKGGSKPPLCFFMKGN